MCIRDRARARALFAAGVLAGEQGDYAQADTLIGESQDIARQLGDKTGVAVSLNALAVFARDRGDVAIAHALFEESLVLWRELSDQKAVARALSNLANVLKLQGDYDRARSLYAECLAIFQGPVSYTHLDVYKRQGQRRNGSGVRSGGYPPGTPCRFEIPARKAVM